MFALLALIFSFSAFSQIQIEVTAPRMMEASSVKVIDRKKIAATGEKNIIDLLKTEAGVDVAQAGLGGQSSVFIRGGESSHVLVLIDGIEVNDPSDPARRFNFNLVEISDIESIEIIKGARSVQYGSDAISGVVNIVTKRNLGIGKQAFKARQEVGSFSTTKTNASFRKRENEHFQYGLKGQYYQTSGYSVAKSSTPTDKDRVARAKINADTSLNFSGHEMTILGEYQKLAQDLDGGPNADDPNARMNSFNSRIVGTYQSSWMNDQIIPRLDASYVTYQRDYSDPADPVTSFPGESTTIGALKKIDYGTGLEFIRDFKINLGGEYQEESMKVDSLTSSYRMDEARMYSHGVFALAEYKLNSLDTYFGLRTDKGSTYSHQENYRGALNYHVNSDWTFLTSYGTGFKAPSLNQLFVPVYGNRNIRSEKSETIDLGTKYVLNKQLEFESTYFLTSYQDLILYNSATNRNENTDKARISGIENSLDLKLNPLMHFDFTYTYMEARDESRNTPLPTRSRNKGSIDWMSDWTEHVRSTLTMTMVGKRKDSTTSTIVNPGYATFTGSADYIWDKNLKFGGRIENLLDKKYLEFNGYNTARRSYFVNLTYSFE